MKPTIPIRRLEEIIEYRPETGEMFRRVDSGRWGSIKAGTPMGCQDAYGYLVAVIDGHQYKLHRIAWAIITGEWPDDGMQIDHINGNREDNRACNLRHATARTNSHNRHASSRPGRSSSKHIGVCRHRKTGRWMARITVDYRCVYLGLFGSEEEASDAYSAAKASMHEPIREAA